MHTSIRIAWLGVLLPACLAMAAAAASQPLAPQFPSGRQGDVWVLAGQSNMAGNGLMKEPIPTDPEILMLNMDNTWMTAEEPVHRLFESVAPVHKRIFVVERGDMTDEGFEQRREGSRRTPLGRVGPSLFFARHVREYLDRPIALVPCAHGGTTMKEWSPALKDRGGDSLYGAMLERIELIGATGRVKGLLWYQGESEAMTPTESATYDEVFLDLVDSLRRDLDQPGLPVIFVQIGRWTVRNDPRGPHWETVRERQRLAAARRDNLFMVCAIDLRLDDQIHIAFEGNRRLGRRMAEVALTHVYGVDGHATPIDLRAIEVQDRDGARPRVHVRYDGVTGRLDWPGRAVGFELRVPGANGQTPDVHDIVADPDDPAALILRFARPIPAGAQLVYGSGMNPCVNIVDEADMAAPAFGPLPLP